MDIELFEKAPVHKAYFKIALPLVFSMVVTLIYNLVDTFFVAQTNNTNLIAGVSLCMPAFTLFIAIGDIFGLGGGSLISRLLGQKKYEDTKRVSAFCCYASLIFGLLVAVLLMVFRTPILTMLGADSQTFFYASQYYTYIVIAAPFIIFQMVPSNLLRTEGLAVPSMIITILGAVINIILDPIFIFTLNMGAAGAAIATIIGYICSDILFVWVMVKRSKHLSIMPKICKIKINELKQLLAIGLPASITNITQSFGLALTNLFLLPFGNDKIAAMGIVMKVNMIAVLILIAFAFGVQPLIGYNYGAKNYQRLKEILKFSVVFECGCAIILTLVLSFTSPIIMSTFVNDVDLINMGSTMLRMQLISMVFVAISLLATSVFQSTGKGIGALVISISRQGVVLVIAMLTASKIFGYNGVLISQAISDTITAIISVILFLSIFRGSFKLYTNKESY